MTAWQFYVEQDPNPDRRPSVKIMRRRVEEPLMCAEALRRDGLWWRSDQLFRQYMLGSDSDFEEVTEVRAAAVLREWIASGLDVSLTGPSHDRPDAESVARFTALDVRSRELWSAVPSPEGQARITARGPADDKDLA